MSAAARRPRVAVTGAAGKLGRAVVADLAVHGREVLALDRVRPAHVDTEFLTVDLTDHAQVLEVLGGHVDEHPACRTRWSTSPPSPRRAC